MCVVSMSELDSEQQGYGGTCSLHYEGDIAVLTMDCGENRFNDAFVDKMNTALDEVLR